MYYLSDGLGEEYLDETLGERGKDARQSFNEGDLEFIRDFSLTLSLKGVYQGTISQDLP